MPVSLRVRRIAETLRAPGQATVRVAQLDARSVSVAGAEPAPEAEVGLLWLANKSGDSQEALSYVGRRSIVLPQRAADALPKSCGGAVWPDA